MYLPSQKCKQKQKKLKDWKSLIIVISCCSKLLLVKTVFWSLLYGSPVTTDKSTMISKITYFFLMSSVFSIFTQPRSQDNVKKIFWSSPRNEKTFNVSFRLELSLFWGFSQKKVASATFCLINLLFTLKRFHTLFWYFHCWLLTSQCRLDTEQNPLQRIIFRVLFIGHNQYIFFCCCRWC